MAVLTLSSATGRADWAYTRWGMTPEQVAQASKGAVAVLPKDKWHKTPENNLQMAAQGTHGEGAVKLNVSFLFDMKTGGLSCVTYAVADPAQSKGLEDALVKRHGPPDSRGGLPAIGMTTLEWRAQDEIDLTMTQGERAWTLHCAKSN
jgi:hypothetical protein